MALDFWTSPTWSRRACGFQRYQEALTFISQKQAGHCRAIQDNPRNPCASATGPAPIGLTSTRDSRMNSPWTALGTPAISVPIPIPAGLPLGLQLTAAHGQDARVLHTAKRIAALFDSHA